MKMVAHQYIGMNSHVAFPGMISQQLDHPGKICTVPKDELAICAALNQVMRLASNCQSGKSCHATLRTL
jgi:hypothetical protein